MKLNKKQREILKTKYEGRCAYCGEILPDRWHADHIIPVRRNYRYDEKSFRYVFDGTYENPENNTLDNFTPACVKCNTNKHQLTIEQFRSAIKQYVESLNKYYPQYQMAKKYNLVSENDIEVKFYFEIYEESRNYCSCDFVIVDRDKHGRAFCYECKNFINEKT